ncbi:DUF2264 domain-containing protein [Kitasatospora herbaricolor]|uniref:DUF2264 domain-containing protein n=1 Tax=Kitasatospora herbaricolor TaxID=68217 RepID=A0ABZ1W3G5_9ACTN|nr:DUF2264 domain-containing protein [Kitasatospora herbaricolor]
MPQPPRPFPFPLPPEDRVRSPRTGWTRAHWEAVADGLLAAVRPHAGPGQALINLPGARPSWSGPRSDGLEGYARTFLLAAFRIAGAGGADPGGLLERYAAGLDAGTRAPTTERAVTADDPHSWPAITDRGQAMVEAASVALALRLTRPWLWDRLDDGVRERAGGWLAQALHRTPNDNNWWLFPLTVGAFLAEAGIEPEAARRAVDLGLAKIEQWYRGDGWYTDGRPRAFDHYNGWALHLYPVLHAHLCARAAAGAPTGTPDHADPTGLTLLDTYGPRLAAYLDGYARTFGADGAPVHQGRSLGYRFAAAAPLWAGALTGHTPLSPGTTRRLASGALRHFLERGAAAPDGLLSLGWYGPYPPMVQPYSGPASPYWASKGFVGLLLPPDHPAWTDPEEPGPAERADAVHPLPRPGWLVQSTAADGLVRLHNHGSDDQPADETLPDDPLYARLAHSTATGPSAPGDIPDNHFGLLSAGVLSERGRIRPLGSGPGWAASGHRPRSGGTELPGAAVTSVVLARGADEIHAHLVTGAAPGTGVRQSGWPVAGPAVRSGTTGTHAWVRTEGRNATGSEQSGGEQPGGEHSGQPENEQSGSGHDGRAGLPDHPGATRPPQGAELHCGLTRVHGFSTARAVPLAGGTAYGPAGAVPVLDGVTTGRPGGDLFVSGARLGAAPPGAGPDAAAPPEPASGVLARTGHSPDGAWVEVTWPDGTRQHAVLRADTVTVRSEPAAGEPRPL